MFALLMLGFFLEIFFFLVLGLVAKILKDVSIYYIYRIDFTDW